jgi:hypothetical protein
MKSPNLLEDINSDLPEWYKTFISFYCKYDYKLINIKSGEDHIFENFSFKEAYWEMMTLLMPYNFESYAILLHQPADFYTEEFPLQTRKEIYTAYGISIDNIDLSDIENLALLDDLMWRNSTEIESFEIDDLENGRCSRKQFDFIASKINSFFNGDIYYHYGILKCISYGKSDIDSSIRDYKLFKSSSFLIYDELEELSRIATQPDGIFSINGNWAIITDYDQPYTFIGGSRELINSLISEKYDLYEIKPKYIAMVLNEKIKDA